VVVMMLMRAPKVVALGPLPNPPPPSAREGTWNPLSREAGEGWGGGKSDV